jgi:5'-nucleotidase
MKDLQILLTNDDGIRSPGLWAAAQALSSLGFVHVVAPRDQFSGAGRSLPLTTDGRIQAQPLRSTARPGRYARRTPAQAVLHAVLRSCPADLTWWSQINYGKTWGTGITIPAR